MTKFRFIEETDENGNTIWYTERCWMFFFWSEVASSRANHKDSAERRFNEIATEHSRVKKILQVRSLVYN